MARKATSAVVKRVMPSSLFHRFMMMVLVPMFLLQITSFYIFFHRYWSRTVKRSLAILVEEIRTINRKYDSCRMPHCDRSVLLENVNFSENFRIGFREKKYFEDKNRAAMGSSIERKFFLNPLGRFASDLHRTISDQVDFFRVDRRAFAVAINKPDGALIYWIDKKTIFIPRVNLLIFWNAISFLAIATVAFIFVKNQMRSIELLKNFANDFSYLEKDNVNFKPTGAKEIREVGWAFLNVVGKMKNLMNTRTTMLAQISHDLRTPLTRMKLQAEFIDDEEIAKSLGQDLGEMERMIDEYILFARGVMKDSYSLTDIRQFFSGIIDDYGRGGYRDIHINFDLRGGVEIFLKIDSFRRCINNILNNSLRYRRKIVDISVRTNDYNLAVVVDDDGNGLEKDMLKKIRRPFYSTMTDKDGNFGLGLTIVQHIVDMHRGKVYFGRSKSLGGLSVSMIIPMLRKIEKESHEPSGKH
ncbi:MAG: hypothetical protein LBI70_03940 [Rickettsiales bacterium]|jgi:two-component system osmolarity sensor histidine kinase EnvZ|nr:hypothetical protein [Rickettsiales bacterium]